jgi:uncharacterized coiled-coil DUF342 family protein
MLSQQQLDQLITENDSLKVQVDELNDILLLREEELELLRSEAAVAVELRSKLDQQLDELQSMQNHIGEKQQQAEGATERELEMEQELTEAARLYQRYNGLIEQYTHTQAQLLDFQEQLADLDKKNQLLQQIAGRIGEIESHLANTVMERDELKARIAVLENAQA